MKKLAKWIAGFFSSESNNSSKRLVGIIGAFFLYWTLWDNSHSESHIAPADSLVYAVTILVGVSLGLTTIESVAKIIRPSKEETIEPQPPTPSK